MGDPVLVDCLDHLDHVDPLDRATDLKENPESQVLVDQEVAIQDPEENPDLKVAFIHSFRIDTRILFA